MNIDTQGRTDLGYMLDVIHAMRNRAKGDREKEDSLNYEILQDLFFAISNRACRSCGETPGSMVRTKQDEILGK